MIVKTVRLALIMVIAVVCTADIAVADEPEAVYMGWSRAVKFDVSPPLRDIPPLPVGKPPLNLVEPDSGITGKFGPQSVDPVVQSWSSSVDVPAPSVSFDGPPNVAGYSPPDPVGDVGPNHYVAMTNVHFGVYDKTGTLLYGPAANNTLWSGFGGSCESNNDGDPVVLHDQLADRWILTQFALGSTNYNCVAVSTTPDPTGTYYRWAFTTGPNMPDYPKYGVWPDALYISTREFNGPFVGVGAYAVNRAELIAGNPSPMVIEFLIPPGGTPYNVGDGLLPSDLDGMIQPPMGSPNYFVGSMDDGAQYGAPQDALTVWEFNADFTTPANSSFNLVATVPTAPFDSVFPCSPGSRDCIPQPGTSNKIDHQGYRQRTIFRLAYRNFGDHESLVTNQSVEAAPGISGVRWYEIRNPGASATIYQQGTFAPGVSDGIHRWMGSIAMDEAGNIALGYSASDGSSTYPSSWYAGRLSGDPLGTLPQGEGSFIDGTGSQTGSQRWGDYSSMNIDPLDDCTFWYVNEYVPTTSSVGWRLRVGSFKFDECGTPDFYLSADPQAEEICTGTDATFDISVGSISSFNNPVTLSASGNPAGTTASFGTNPVAPPGTSLLTIGNTGVAAAGSYVVNIGGTAAASPGHDIDLDLDVYDAVPGVPNLTAPVDGAPNQSLTPTFEWATPAQGAYYTLEVDDDPGFGSPEIFESGLPDTSFTPDAELQSNTVYYWRVTSENTCGSGTASAVWSFTTIAMPGDCGLGTVPMVHFTDDFESGAPGWTTAGSGSTWALTAGVTGPHSGAWVYHADDISGITDQHLVSPAMVLPSGPNHTAITLQFWTYQELEDGGDGCYDGGILEISTDGGSNWTYLPTTVMQTDPYDGPIDDGFSNPLIGFDAWCGDPQAWLRSVVELDAYAGETAQFRFRLGTDSSVSHPGWDVDDVWVQSCVPEGTDDIFADGFESGDVSAWDGQTTP